MSTTERPLALVTGASSGIGFDLARQFLSNGFDTVIVAENDKIHTAAEELKGLDGDAYAEQIDLTDTQGMARLHAAVAALGRPLEAVAINAGIGVGGPFVETDLEAELKTIDLNVISTVVIAKWVASDMAQRNQGKILFTSSVISRAPAPFQAIYGASKAFVQSFGQALRNELKDTGVTVTTLLPGPTETDFFERADLLDTKVGSDDKDDPALVAKQGFKALMDGDGNVLGGSLKSRTMGLGSNVMPDAAGAEFNRKLSEPGSGKDK